MHECKVGNRKLFVLSNYTGLPPAELIQFMKPPSTRWIWPWIKKHGVVVKILAPERKLMTDRNQESGAKIAGILNALNQISSNKKLILSVVDECNRNVGLITLSDLLELLAEELLVISQ